MMRNTTSTCFVHNYYCPILIGYGWRQIIYPVNQMQVANILHTYHNNFDVYLQQSSSQVSLKCGNKLHINITWTIPRKSHNKNIYCIISRIWDRRWGAWNLFPPFLLYASLPISSSSHPPHCCCVCWYWNILPYYNCNITASNEAMSLHLQWCSDTHFILEVSLILIVINIIEFQLADPLHVWWERMILSHE